MDYETVPAPELGRALKGIGLNLLSRDVPGLAAFLEQVFGMKAHRVGRDFAIVAHGDALMQIHSDAAYGSHPLLSLLPETPPRAAGVQVYLFGVDPDEAAARAEAAGGMVLEPPADKPHGLRECTILAPEGQAFSPATNSRKP
ncbi:VOC family protein [Ostreiculturibacter nitratireducens]|uniref:VOC family protein n=1 Tax=Ostreiculturibacter nitratireducens TaxID=3075226 RepID=UPI0031B64E66